MVTALFYYIDLNIKHRRKEFSAVEVIRDEFLTEGKNYAKLYDTRNNKIETRFRNIKITVPN